jgi:prevent-host-death family protein
MSATEASRSFARVLDDAERGEVTVVTRGGRRIAVIGPVEASNGQAVLDLLESGLPDAAFANDVRAVRHVASPQGPAWPDD